MAKLFSAREIATLALRKIGVVSGLDTASSEGKVQIALQHLDLILAHKAGTSRIWSLVPQSATFSYTADAESVNVTSLLGSGNQLDLFRHAYNDDTDQEITLLRRAEFDQYRSAGTNPYPSGDVLYIAGDGDDSYTAYLRPVPTAAKTIRITGQRFSATVSAASNSNSAVAHGFDTAFQLWMVSALAYITGDGPLARMPEDRLARFNEDAARYWIELTSRRGLGQTKAARFTRAWTG